MWIRDGCWLAGTPSAFVLECAKRVELAPALVCMCHEIRPVSHEIHRAQTTNRLLYTFDAADDLLSVVLGVSRNPKK